MDDHCASPRSSGRRALIISASVGAGHDAVAAAYATDLLAAGFTEVVTRDFVDAAPWLARMVLRHFYEPQVQRAPDNFTWMIDMLQRPTWVWLIIRATAILSCPGILDWVRPARPDAVSFDVIVSTYPLATQSLGFLRARGWVGAPVVGQLADVGLHWLWFHPAVDLHLGTLRKTMEKAAAAGYRCGVVSPVVRKESLTLLSEDQRAHIRRKLNLESQDMAILLTAGSLGFGRVVDTVKAVLSHPRTKAVVLCGKNKQLQRDLAQYDRVIPLGWQDNIGEIYAAADVVVHNASYMAEEARAAGVPMVTYNPLPGHGLLNAKAYDQSGLSEWPKTASDLVEAIDCAAEKGHRNGVLRKGTERDHVREVINLACHKTHRQGRDLNAVATSIFRILSIVIGTCFYMITLPGWLPVLAWIRLPSPSTFAFYVRSATALLSLGISITIGLFVALYWQVLDHQKAPLGMVVASRIFSFINQHALGILVSMKGQENFPPTPAVYVVNHQSELDLLVVGALFSTHLHNGIVLAKSSLRRAPLLGWFLAAIGTGWVHRVRDPIIKLDHHASNAQGLDRGSDTRPNNAVDEAIRQVRDRGRSIFIFPEGTRSRFSTPNLLPFKTGGFAVAAETHVPVVPVVVKNYSEIYSLHSRRWLPGNLEVDVLPPKKMFSSKNKDGVWGSDNIQQVAEDVRSEMLLALQSHSGVESRETWRL